MFHQNRSANADRRATLVCFVTNFFPKLMRCFLSYCIKQNGLTNKYCNNTRNPSILTPTELLLIQELPSIENFTIHLCYKFITLEELLPKPSNGWGKFPDEKRLEVEDDIERIRHAINEIITTNDDECTKNYFVKFLYKLERIIQRVQIALGNKTLYVIFKSFLIKNIDTEVVLGEFINVDIIRGSNIEHIKLQDRERYSKISAVITEFFPKLLRNILQSKVSPSMLYNLCIKPGVHWNYSEKSQVNTLKSSNNYESLDASMLYKLFRTFTCVDEPTQGWGKLPTNYDLSISDDIERIRILRNKSAHRCDTRIDQTEFENQFLQFHDITRRISIDHENELTAIETDSLDHKRQIELEKALHELEDIKERFEKDYVRYYWGNKFEMKIKDIRQRIKTGKVIIGKGTIAIDIELPNVDDTETRAKILNEFKDEVNEGDLKIKFIAAITGSLIIHADIDTNALITNTSLQEELTSFMTRILNTGRLQITSFQWIDAVIFLAEGNMELDLNSSVAKSLRLQFNVDMDVFETDEQFESEMNACMQRTIKNLNGKGFIGEVTAIVDSEQSDNTEETLRMDTCRSSPIIDKSVEFENWDKIVSGTSGKDFRNTEVELWKEQDVMFVKTPVVKVISEILESEHCVLIVGEHGIGKSMLMHHVALKLQTNMRYTIIPCSRIQDIYLYHIQKRRTIFVVDDICGRAAASLVDIEYLINNGNHLNHMLKRRNAKIVASCRFDIYRDEMCHKSCTVFKPNIINLSAEYSREDKLMISTKYLNENSIQVLKDQKEEFTPLMCFLYSKNEHFNLTDFLNRPYETYQNEWIKLKSIDPCKYYSLFLCVIYNGFMEGALFESYNENNIKNKCVFEDMFEIFGINRSTSRRKIKTVLDSSIGIYLLKKGNDYRIIHDQLLDFLCYYFGNNDTMVRYILRFSDIKVFNERTQLESINEQHSQFTILIPKRYEKDYFERIKNDIQLGKLKQCFCNSQMKHEKYRALFLNVLKSNDDKLLVEQIFPRQNLQHMFRHRTNVDVLKKNENEIYAVTCHKDNLAKELLIISCLRGYYDVVQYFISKDIDKNNEFLFDTPLAAACKGGNEKIVLLLMDKGWDVTKAYGMDETHLTAACHGGNEKIVQLLIDKGCDVNKASGIGETSLTAACKERNEKIVQLLIDKGCDVNMASGIGDTPLIAACKEKIEKIVQLLLDKGCDANKASGMGETSLTAACWGGDEKIVQLLIARGCDINQADGRDQTPLATACMGRHEKIVQLLIDRGCDINKASGIGETPLTAACKEENEKIVQLLIDRGCDFSQASGLGKTPLTVACQKGNEKIVKLLVDIGCDVNQANEPGETPLIAACEVGNEKIVQLLIDKGCDINQASGTGETPLTTACLGGYEKILQLLIVNGCDIKTASNMISPLTAACLGGNEMIVLLLMDRGCDVNQAHSIGYTPLTAACMGSNEKIVQLLIDKGGDVKQANGRGETPLTAACMGGNEKIVQLLIDKGGDVNQAYGMGETPLKAACIGGNEKIIQLLIDKGGDVNQANGRGETPLTAACMGGNEKIVQLLIDKGGDVNQARGRSETPLTAACLGGNEKIVQLLIDKGGDVNQASGRGKTPLTVACMGGKEKIVQLIMNRGCDISQVTDIRHPNFLPFFPGRQIIDRELEKPKFQTPGMDANSPTTASKGDNEKNLQILEDHFLKRKDHI